MKRTEVIKNTGSKLCKQLLSMVDFSQGNNYEDTHIHVRILNNSVIVFTSCVNEYGSLWCNENYTEVSKSDIPFFTAKKLGML